MWKKRLKILQTLIEIRQPLTGYYCVARFCDRLNSAEIFVHFRQNRKQLQFPNEKDAHVCSQKNSRFIPPFPL